MIQSMEILQMAGVALEERIESELSDNPVLERVQDSEEDSPADDSRSERSDGPAEKEPVEKPEAHSEMKIEEGNAEDFERLLSLPPDHFDDGPRTSANRISEIGDRQHDLMANIVDNSETLQDYLTLQLHEKDLEPELLKICERIVSSLSPEDGGRFNGSLRDLLPPDADEEQMEQAENALATVQLLDPAGIAARDLGECLQMQLNSKIPNLKLVRQLIENHLKELSTNKLPQIQKATGATIEEITEAWNELRKLDPLPASRFAERIVPRVTPDVFVTKNEDGSFTVKMEEGQVRSLNISRYYLQRLSNGQATADEKEFIKKKITSAQWLIESIEQRRNTLTRIAQAIVNYQHKYLAEGREELLEPLKMQQIADEVGVHVTTVSRAVDDKWIETPRGILALRLFFVGGTTTDSGEDIAWNKIRVELQKLIDSEDKSHPLSDDELVKRLKSLGFPLARRTVAKYRKKMDIPSSRQRKDWTLKKD